MIEENNMDELRDADNETIEQIARCESQDQSDVETSVEEKISSTTPQLSENLELPNDDCPQEETSEKSDATDVKTVKHPGLHKLFAVFIFFGFIAVIGRAIQIWTMEKKPHCLKQFSFELACSNVSVFEGWERNGKMNFTVTFPRTIKGRGIDYKGNVGVGKTPTNLGEYVSLRGEEIIWSGSHDLSDESGIPKSVLSFHDKSRPEEKKCHHFYHVNCPLLDSMLEENAKKWRQIHEQPKASAFDILSTPHGAILGANAFVFGLIVNVINLHRAPEAL